MTTQELEARSALEALRSGVPSRHVVSRLGTTQSAIQAAFEEAIENAVEGRATQPLVVTASFGAGKSHLLNYLRTLAEGKGFVTAYLVVSPEMPLGKPQVVLRTIAESAQAPGRTGKALRELATSLRTQSAAFGELRRWADAQVHPRFSALLHIYEHFWVYEELRVQILEDVEGKQIPVATVRSSLREMGETASYDVRAPRLVLLAHDRLRLLAQFYRACTGRGLVVLLDEMERLQQFTRKQRLAAYEELGRWRQLAAQPGSGVVLAMASTTGFVEETLRGKRNDEQYVDSYRLVSRDFPAYESAQLILSGVDLLTSPPHYLDPPSPEQEEQIRYRVRDLYQQAYGVSLPDAPLARGDVRTSIRSEVRRWITLWDLHRYDPDYQVSLEEEQVVHDEREVPDSELPDDDEAE